MQFELKHLKSLQNHNYAFLIFWMPLLLAAYIVSIIIAWQIFGAASVVRWASHLNRWFEASTKISFMQSVFQLGAATSAAFAIAGPQIQHALGPRVQGAIQHAKRASMQPNAPMGALKQIAQTLRHYDKFKKDEAAMRRSRIYPFHLTITATNILLLLWSSVIDPRGEIQNKWAVIILFGCIFAPFVELKDAFSQARHIRPLIQKAMDACDSNMFKRIEAARNTIEAEIKAYPFDP